MDAVQFFILLIIIIVIILIIINVKPKSSPKENRLKIDFGYMKEEKIDAKTTTYTHVKGSKTLTSKDMENAKLLLGTKYNPSEVRGIQIGEDYYFPPYGKDPKWSVKISQGDKPAVVSVEGTESWISIDKTINTAHECWGMNSNSMHLSETNFLSLVSLMM
jgi:hypothetical protein